MNWLRVLLVAAAAFTILAVPAGQAANRSTPIAQRPILLAEANDDIAAAEAAVAAARAAYRTALVAGDERRVRRARKNLDEAVRALDEALADADLPPSDLTRAIAMDEAAAAQRIVENARAALRDAMAKGRLAKVDRAKKRLNRALADLDAARAALGLKPGEEIDEVAIDETPPPDAPPAAAAASEPPPPAEIAVAEPPSDQPAVDLDRSGKKPPRFGAVEPGDKKAVALPSTEAAVKEGEEIEAEGGRVIVKESGQVIIKHDDSERLRAGGSQTEVVTARNGTTTTTVTRRNGVQVVTVRDRDGNILQRYRKRRDGSVEMLIGEAQRAGSRKAPPPPPAELPSIALDFLKRLPPVLLNIPQQDYIVQSSRASQRQLEQALVAPPVEQVERAYSLEEIRRSGRLRDKVRRIDFDTVTFEFGSAVVPDDQIPKMQQIGMALQAIIARDPSQVILIEGHTDAVGSDLANLALSDRRAETVAEILTYYFNIAPENLVTQGYGEQFLKIPTVQPERQNRRVAMRNITWLMRAQAR